MIEEIKLFDTNPEIEDKYDLELYIKYNKLARALNNIISNCNLAEKHKPDDFDELSSYEKGQYLVIDNIRKKLIEDLK